MASVCPFSVSISYNILCAHNEDSDERAPPHMMIRVYADCLKTLWIIGYPNNALKRLFSDCANAQADLSLRWAYMNCCRKWCARTHLSSNTECPDCTAQKRKQVCVFLFREWHTELPITLYKTFLVLFFVCRHAITFHLIHKNSYICSLFPSFTAIFAVLKDEKKSLGNMRTIQL